MLRMRHDSLLLGAPPTLLHRASEEGVDEGPDDRGSKSDQERLPKRKLGMTADTKHARSDRKAG